jgi:hypothetical protein
VTATILAIAGATPPAHLRGTPSFPSRRSGSDRAHARADRELGTSGAASRAIAGRTSRSRASPGTIRPWRDLLAWAPAGGPALRRSEVPTRASSSDCGRELVALRAGSSPRPVATTPRDDRYKEALRTGGYWSP